MFKKNKSKVVRNAIRILILLVLGIVLIYNNIMQIMNITETTKQIKESIAYASTDTIVGGSMAGASVKHQYDYKERHILFKAWNYYS